MNARRLIFRASHGALAVGLIGVTISICSGATAQFKKIQNTDRLTNNAGGAVSRAKQFDLADTPEDPPSYLPWYTAPPTPLSGAYVSIGGASGNGNIYNTNAGYGTVGTAMLNTNQCFFVCFGGPGSQSHHYLAYGNNVNPPNVFGAGTSFTHHGAADDCQVQGGCPGGIHNQVFGTTVMVSPMPSNDPFFVTLDQYGRFAAVGHLYAGAAVIAGAGAGTLSPIPSPSNGSLVSYTGMEQGDILLGSSGAYTKCDFGETLSSTMTCAAPLRSTAAGTASPGTIGPCYTQVGLSCDSTFHFVKNNNNLNVITATACTNETWCALDNAAIALTASNSQFSNTNYSCALSSTSSYLVNLTVNGQSTTGFTIQAFNNSGTTIVGGTNLGLTYVCFGV